MRLHSSKDEAIKTAIVAQVASLLEDHFEAVVSAAQENFKQDEDAGEIEAKLGFAVSFFPAVQSPKVTVKVKWSVNYTDEAETIVDPDQAKLSLEPKP